MQFPERILERLDEDGRKVLFHSSYIASASESGEIHPHHLLEALTLVDRALKTRFTPKNEAIRRQIKDQRLRAKKEVEARAVPPEEIVLGSESIRCIDYAADEAGRAGRRLIDTYDFVLGIFRMDGCLATQLLLLNGIDQEVYRGVVEQIADRKAIVLDPAAMRDAAPGAPTDDGRVDRIVRQLEQALDLLNDRWWRSWRQKSLPQPMTSTAELTGFWYEFGRRSHKVQYERDALAYAILSELLDSQLMSFGVEMLVTEARANIPTFGVTLGFNDVRWSSPTYVGGRQVVFGRGNLFLGTDFYHRREAQGRLLSAIERARPALVDPK